MDRILGIGRDLIYYLMSQINYIVNESTNQSF